jgi:ubiquinone/menaquinone biosynthesis C-methylase UbiE
VIKVRPDVKISSTGGISCYLDNAVLSSSDLKEFSFRAKLSEQYSTNHGTNVFDDVIYKTEFIRAFRRLIPRLKLTGTEKVLEMGAGHGWASVLLKRHFPACYIVASDLVSEALQFCIHYEQILGLSIDEKWAFHCRAIPFEDNTFDRIFTMAAFHHFGQNNDFTGALEEMIRILKPNGKIALLYEPSAPRFLYPLINKIVNSRRSEENVEEDVLVISDLRKYSEKAGCKCNIEYYPDFRDRSGLKSQLYYFFLSKVAPLVGFTPLLKLAVCCVNITIEKGPAKSTA